MPHMKSDAVIKLTDRCDQGGDRSVSLCVLWTLFQAFDAHVSSCSAHRAQRVKEHMINRTRVRRSLVNSKILYHYPYMFSDS